MPRRHATFCGGYSLKYLRPVLRFLVSLAILTAPLTVLANDDEEEEVCPAGQLHFNFKLSRLSSGVVSEGILGGKRLAKRTKGLPRVAYAHCDTGGPAGQQHCLSEVVVLDLDAPGATPESAAPGTLKARRFVIAIWEAVESTKSRIVARCLEPPHPDGKADSSCLAPYMHFDLRNGEVTFRESKEASSPAAFWISGQSERYPAATPRCIPSSFEVPFNFSGDAAGILVEGTIKSSVRGVWPVEAPVVGYVSCSFAKDANDIAGCITEQAILGPHHQGEVGFSPNGMVARRFKMGTWDIFKADETTIVAQCAGYSKEQPQKMDPGCADPYMHINRKTGEVIFTATPDPESMSILRMGAPRRVERIR